MPVFQKALAVGNRLAFGWFIDDNGFMLGANTTAPANGLAGSGAFNLEGIKTAAPTQPDPDIVPVTGDDALLAEFSFDAIDARTFTAEFSVTDLTIISQITGVTVQTWGEVRAAIMDIPSAPERNMGFLFQSRAKKRDTGVVNQKGWHSKIIPLATATPLGRASFDERGAAVFRMSISPQTAGYDPLAFTIQTANYNTTGGRFFENTHENPIHIKAYRGDAAAVLFNLDYTPISAAKTYFAVRRVNVPVTTVSTANKTFSVGVAPALGAEGIVLYEFVG